MTTEIFINVEQMANQLGISLSTVKKYYLLIEEKGYSFKRNNDGHVLFSEDDYKIFKKIIEIKSQPKTTLNQAVDEVIRVITGMTNTTDITVTTPSNTPAMTDVTVITEEIQELKDMIIQQNQMIAEQNQLINTFILTNDENKKLLELTENSKLLKQNLQRTQELKEIISSKPEKSWWRFWD